MHYNYNKPRKNLIKKQISRKSQEVNKENRVYSLSKLDWNILNDKNNGKSRIFFLYIFFFWLVTLAALGVLTYPGVNEFQNSLFLVFRVFDFICISRVLFGGLYYMVEAVVYLAIFFMWFFITFFFCDIRVVCVLCVWSELRVVFFVIFCWVWFSCVMKGF